MANQSTPPPDQDGPAYSVGYGHPPKEHQFKKGQSGNPRGRPRRSNDVIQHFKELLDKDQIGKNGEVVSRREAIVLKIIKGAMEGDQYAFKIFLDLLEKAGLLSKSARPSRGPIELEIRPVTAEEYEEFKRNLGRELTPAELKKMRR